MKLLTVEETAEMLKCSIAQVNNLVAKRLLINHKPINRCFVKVDGQLVELPEKLIGKRRPKAVYFESDILNYLKNA